LDAVWDGPKQVVQFAMVKLRVAIEAPEQGQDCHVVAAGRPVTTGINELA